MKILMTNYEFPPIGGGAGKANLCLLSEYANNKDLQIDVLTSAPEPGFTVEQFADNITIYRVGVHKKDLHHWRKIEVLEWLLKANAHYRRLLRQNSYDLAHAFFGFPTAWLCYRTRSQLPYIISLRGSDVPGYNVRLTLDYKLLAGLFRRIWKNASAVIANSKGLAALAHKFTPDLAIGVIPNGINIDKFSPAPTASLHTPLRILTVCRLVRRKRIELLIEAVDHLTKAGRDVRLNIAGQGSRTEQLCALAQRLGLAEKINFMSRVPIEQMPQLYRDSDIFVMASAHEGMSNAMLEAMASGLPIITTQCEGIEELITDNGIIVDPCAETIARAIAELTEDPVRYEQMCRTASTCAKKFTWRSVAEEYMKYYRSKKSE